MTSAGIARESNLQEAQAADLILGEEWHVDIEQDFARKSILYHLAYNTSGQAGRRAIALRQVAARPPKCNIMPRGI